MSSQLTPRLLTFHEECPEPLQSAFQALNLDWIEEHFHVEDSDRRLLGDPTAHVLDRGGALLFLMAGGGDSSDELEAASDEKVEHVLGTCALIPFQDASVELAKMAVSPAVRGRGLGRRLLRAALKEASAMGYERVVLTTSRRLPAAVALYRSEGFEEARLGLADGYDRGDLEMSRPV